MMSDVKTRLTRRTAMKTLAASVASLMIGSVLPQQARAASPLLGAAHPTHYRYKLGDFEITAIWDGAIDVPRVHPVFGGDQPAEVVAQLLSKNFLPTDKVKFMYTPAIINTGKELIALDTGNGPGKRREAGGGKLAGSLAAAGFGADQIDIVILTHYHPDHIGGLLDDGKQLFPNARYVTGQAEYDFWSPIERASGPLEAFAKQVQSNVVPLADRMTFLKPGEDVVSGITAVDAKGHTPGHMAFHFESNGSRMLHFVDTCNHYIASMLRPDWHFVFDMDKADAAASRKRILDMAAADRLLTSGYHMPFPAVGFVEKLDTGYRWVPASYQI